MAVVFSDSFTTGSNQTLQAYDPASYQQIGATAASINAANDRIEMLAGTLALYRCINAAAPTGDQAVQATANLQANFSSASVLARMPTTNTETGYEFRISPVSEGQLFRVSTTGTRTTLRTGGSILTSTAYVIALSAVGTGAQVDLTPSIDGVALTPYPDTAAARHTSGTPGLRVESDFGTTWMDDYSIDNLVAGGGTTHTRSVSEGIRLGDSLSSRAVRGRARAEGMTFGDTFSAVLLVAPVIHQRSVSDGLRFGDAPAALHLETHPAATSDGLRFGDLYSAVLTHIAQTFQRSTTEGIRFSDAQAGQRLTVPPPPGNGRNRNPKRFLLRH